MLIPETTQVIFTSVVCLSPQHVQNVDSIVTNFYYFNFKKKPLRIRLHLIAFSAAGMICTHSMHNSRICYLLSDVAFTT